MGGEVETFVEKIRVVEGQAVKKGQLLLELNVKGATAQLAEARAKLLKAKNDLQAAMTGGKADEAARVVGDLAKAEAERDRLQRSHEVLTRLVAGQAATKEDLAANDLALAKAPAEGTRAAAAKQEFGPQGEPLTAPNAPPGEPAPRRKSPPS